MHSALRHRLLNKYKQSPTARTQNSKTPPANCRVTPKKCNMKPKDDSVQEHTHLFNALTPDEKPTKPNNTF